MRSTCLTVRRGRPGFRSMSRVRLERNRQKSKSADLGFEPETFHSIASSHLTSDHRDASHVQSGPKKLLLHRPFSVSAGETRQGLRLGTSERCLQIMNSVTSTAAVKSLLTVMALIQQKP